MDSWLDEEGEGMALHILYNMPLSKMAFDKADMCLLGCQWPRVFIKCRSMGRYTFLDSLQVN